MVLNIFDSIFKSDSIVSKEFMIMIIAGIVIGLILSLIAHYKSESSKSFFITTSLVPVTVAMVIALVNGNLGIGLAVAGAFGLVKFRSAQGNAKEICIIFIGMASGLAVGMGYIAYAFIFTVLASVILVVLGETKIFKENINEENKTVKIVIPENLDYENVFEDVMNTYTNNHRLVEVKTTNMGSMYKLTYNVNMKKDVSLKAFIDELRCLNGNLEIQTHLTEYIKREL